ncbi:M20 family metallopeptidase [Desulfoluna spongiiphila]|uniref:M20 family metallopeptidase n=1 Tax=Desulfoluna spongiiphila TaxID=419481 RepID=UPI00125C0717|nr:M20/M25/M40 family metallo-hydrolase [Desulfoluna spongiiphila]VVS92243.1 peptidase m20 [Desulfoluna spongiiphila]
MNEMVPLLKRLIQFCSVADRPDEITACADFIQGWLTEAGLSVNRMDVHGTPSLWVTPETDRAPVLFMAHFDVVPAGEDLFAPHEEGDRLYGRGAVDDKYAVALCMVLLRAWIRRLKTEGKGQESLPFGVLLTGDEEIGGYNGAGEALKRMSCDYCVALDGGSPERLVVREKGIVRLNLTARGKGAHGARPWLGENAIDTLLDDLVRVRRHFAQTREDHWHRTVNIGCIQGGSAVNQVPGDARAKLDIRYTEADDPHALIEAIRADVTSEVEVVSVDTLFNGGEGPVTRYLAALAGDIEQVAEHASSDARFLNRSGTPGVIWGPQGNMSQHTDEEHVEISSLFTLYGHLDRFVTAVFNKEVSLTD